MSMSDYKESEFGLSVFLLVNTILDQEALRQLVRVNTAHRTGRELCPQWTPLRIWYGRSSSCSCVWPWCRHTARRPPWWAARWRSLADRRQTPSYNLEGGLLWREGEGLFGSSGTGERTYRYICVCVCVCVCVCEPTKTGKNWMMKILVVAFTLRLYKQLKKWFSCPWTPKPVDVEYELCSLTRWEQHIQWQERGVLISSLLEIMLADQRSRFDFLSFVFTEKVLCMPHCILNKRQSK